MYDKSVASLILVPVAILIYVIVFSVLHSCTYNISMVHTEGTATDVIDETSSNAPTVSPTIDLPGLGV